MPIAVFTKANCWCTWLIYVQQYISILNIILHTQFRVFSLYIWYDTIQDIIHFLFIYVVRTALKCTYTYSQYVYISIYGLNYWSVRSNAIDELSPPTKCVMALSPPPPPRHPNRITPCIHMLDVLYYMYGLFHITIT